MGRYRRTKEQNKQKIEKQYNSNTRPVPNTKPQTEEIQCAPAHVERSHIKYDIWKSRGVNEMCTIFKQEEWSIVSFTVVCLVTWPLSGSEAGVDLVLIETSRF